jgi:cytoskeleton protein RodZ
MRQGLDLADCAAATRIRERYLVAIEDDRFESLPDPAYVSGFVRAYAAHLGVEVEGPERTLPAEGAIGSVRTRTVHVPATRATARGVGARLAGWRWVLALLVIAAIVVAALVWSGVVEWPSSLS